MKKLLPFVMLMIAATPLAARADITSRMSSSVQLTVNAAATQAERIGSSFAISGSNIDTTDGTTTAVVDLAICRLSNCLPMLSVKVHNDPPISPRPRCGQLQCL